MLQEGQPTAKPLLELVLRFVENAVPAGAPDPKRWQAPPFLAVMR
jgi:hypothetical protein